MWAHLIWSNRIMKPHDGIVRVAFPTLIRHHLLNEATSLSYRLCTTEPPGNYRMMSTKWAPAFFYTQERSLTGHWKRPALHWKKVLAPFIFTDISNIIPLSKAWQYCVTENIYPLTSYGTTCNKRELVMLNSETDFIFIPQKTHTLSGWKTVTPVRKDPKSTVLQTSEHKTGQEWRQQNHRRGSWACGDSVANETRTSVWAHFLESTRTI